MMDKDWKKSDISEYFQFQMKIYTHPNIIIFSLLKYPLIFLE